MKHLLVLLMFITCARAHAERKTTIHDGVRGAIDLEINEAGDLQIQPRPNEQWFKSKMWKMVFASDYTSFRRRTPEQTESAQMDIGFMKVLDLAVIKGRTFAVVREKEAKWDAPNYLQEVRAQFGRPVHYMDFGFPVGALGSVAWALLYPYDATTYANPAISAAMFALGGIYTAWLSFQDVMNIHSKGYFLEAKGDIIRADEVVRDGDHVVDILISPSRAPLIDQPKSLRAMIEDGCEPALISGAFKTFRPRENQL